MSNDHLTTPDGDEQVGEQTLPDVVSALAASPGFAVDGVCFAARNSGLYRSDDGGASWRPVYGSLALQEDLATTAVALSCDFASDHTVFAGVNGGVLRSTDGGLTWQATLLPEPAPLVTALALSPDYARDGVVFAATMEDGVFRSADRGSTWNGWNFGLLDLATLCIAVSPSFASDETLFVGTESGVFRSTNGGLAWREVAFSPDHAPVLSLALAPDYDDGGVVFAATEEHGVWRSDDGGRSWSALGRDALDGVANAVLVGREFPAVPDVLVLLGDTAMVSRDGGTSWAAWQPGLTLADGAASVSAPEGLGSGATLLVGTVEGGVERL